MAYEVSDLVGASGLEVVGLQLGGGGGLGGGLEGGAGGGGLLRELLGRGEGGEREEGLSR